MTPLDTLISRVRELKGPDREVDALVEAMFARSSDDWPELSDVLHWEFEPQDDGSVNVLVVRTDCSRRRGRYKRYAAPPYTASLDATASLIERELPGYSWGTQKTISGLGFATITRADSHHNWFHGCCSFCRTATAETPTLALLLAFLTAIKERDA